MRRLIALPLLLFAGAQAYASCPATLTDCPSINANNGSFGGNLFGTIAPSGTLPDSRPTWGYNPLGWAIRSTSDNAATTTPGGTVIPSLFYIQQAYGGSNINDGRNGLSIYTQLTAPTSPTNPYRYYVGFSSYSTSQANDRGTAGSPQGILESVTGAASLNNGATNYFALLSAEFAISADAGSSVAKKAALALNDWPSDAVHGSVIDAWIWTTSNTGGVGMNTWADINANAGSFPITTAGTIIKLTGTASNHIATGFDFTATAIDGNVLQWATAAWRLAGNGDAFLRTANVKGINLDMSAGGGFFVSGALPTGTPASFMCFTSGGQMISSLVACH